MSACSYSLHTRLRVSKCIMLQGSPLLWSCHTFRMSCGGVSKSSFTPCHDPNGFDRETMAFIPTSRTKSLKRSSLHSTEVYRNPVTQRPGFSPLRCGDGLPSHYTWCLHFPWQDSRASSRSTAGRFRLGRANSRGHRFCSEFLHSIILQDCDPHELTNESPQPVITPHFRFRQNTTSTHNQIPINRSHGHASS
jgi:hypothetical protein